MVEAIEYNYPRNKILDLLKKLLHNFVDKRNITIILGCTHYEFIKNEISSLLKNCEIIDGSVGVSKQIIKSYKVADIEVNKIRTSKIFSNSKKYGFHKPLPKHIKFRCAQVFIH